MQIRINDSDERRALSLSDNLKASERVSGFRKAQMTHRASALFIYLPFEGSQDGLQTFVQIASSWPLGSVNWKRVPPGKSKGGLVIFPPAATTFFCIPAKSVE